MPPVPIARLALPLTVALLALLPGAAAAAVAVPEISSVTPSAGPATGGTSVGILGTHLGEVTEVRFGAVPATGVSVVSDSALTAIAPVHSPGIVDVVAVDAAGPSPSVPGDFFTYEAAVTVQKLRPVLGAIALSHSTWRAGSRLALLASALAARRPAVGTTFTFTLSTSARLNLGFRRLLPGRSVGGRCVAPTGANKRRRACTRKLPAGSLTLAGHAGTDRVAFQGRLSASRRLRVGRYELALSASNEAGASAVRRASFTIVAG